MEDHQETAAGIEEPVKIRVRADTKVKALGRKLYEEHREGNPPPVLVCIGEVSLRVSFQGVIYANFLMTEMSHRYVVVPTYIPTVDPPLPGQRHGDAFGLRLRLETVP